MIIDTKTFYKAGLWCFGIIAVCSVFNFFIFFKNYNFFSMVASLAQIVFNFIITGFFYYLLKTQTSSLPEETPEDLNRSLMEFDKWTKKNTKDKKN